MAKKKADEVANPVTASTRRRTVLTIKGSDEWSDWLDRLGEHLRTPTSTVVDHALVRYAKEMGFKEDAPKR